MAPHVRRASGLGRQRLRGPAVRRGLRSQEDSAFTGNVGLGYLLDGGVTPYASYSKSFIVNLGQTRSGDMFEPSRGEQYEVGVKYEPTFFPGYITAAVSTCARPNVPTTDPEDPVFQVQTGEVRHRGLELEASADLAFGFNMIAAYTYLDAEILEDNDGSSATGRRWCRSTRPRYGRTTNSAAARPKG